MDDEFKKYSFITPNSDKPTPNKCKPMDIGKYPIITRNLDNFQREREMFPDNKEVEKGLEQEAALQQVKTTLSNVSKQLDKVMKHSSNKGAGLSPSWGYGSELGGGGAAAGADSMRKFMDACKKHDRPDQGGGSGIIDMFKPVCRRSRSSRRKSSSSRRPRKTKSNRRGRSSRRVRR